MSLGIAYLSENRHRDALFTAMPVTRNITVSHLQQFTRAGILNPAAESDQAQVYIQRLNIQTPSPNKKVGSLSGGNQQKVILARWLAIEPRILIADEPTRGIDVGAKVEIYNLLHHLAAQGVGILLISSEMPEIIGMSDRILVMHEGRITGELSRAEATEENIMVLATHHFTDEPGDQNVSLPGTGGPHA
jgi:ABC-type sugar transport system ATPase subunit